MSTLLDRLNIGTTVEAVLTYDTVDSAFIKANSAYRSQNTTGVYANTAYIHANAAYALANTVAGNNTPTLAYLTANGAYLQANTAYNHANSAYVSQNTTGVYANSAYNQSNIATQYALSAGSYANSVFVQSNSHNSYANTTFFPYSGGTITGNVTITKDLVVSGNITISGNSTAISANNLVIDDSIIYLGNTATGNTSDIGFVGHFTQGNYQHTGIVRDATDGKWKFFSNVIPEPTGTTVDFTAPGVYWDTVKVGIIETNASANIGSLTYIGTNYITPMGGATNPILGGLNSSNNYVQMYVYNANNGTQASSDLIAYPNNGNDANGWIDMSTSYAGAGVPGANIVAGGNGSNGCALGGPVSLNTTVASTNKTCTFGTVSSSSTLTNEIYVRIALTSGQSVTALAINTASN